MTINSKNKLLKPGNLKHNVSLVKPALMNGKPHLDTSHSIWGARKGQKYPSDFTRSLSLDVVPCASHTISSYVFPTHR